MSGTRNQSEHMKSLYRLSDIIMSIPRDSTGSPPRDILTLSAATGRDNRRRWSGGPPFMVG